MIQLPENYIDKMKCLLKEEYDDYISSFEKPHCVSIRINTNKIDVETFIQKFPYHLEPVPWTNDGFYVVDDVQLGKDPFYYAGLYYIQEASAMLPAQVLDAKPYERVLDLCAAPGGKSTKLACSMENTGMLFSNDISVSRCQVLLRNLERFGVRNSYVCSESPSKLEKYFNEYFDKILIDAPCSGQGMFRKEPSLIQSYIEKDETYYVPIQKEIVNSAIKMLKPGGRIVYSTCTFDESEDEEIIQYALQCDPSLKVIPIQKHDGFVQNAYGTKLFPHRIKGEGHFVCILEKEGTLQSDTVSNKEEIYTIDQLNLQLQGGAFETRNDKTYYVPNTDASLQGLRILRSGLFIGENKKNRFEINPTLALALQKCEYTNVILLDRDDPQLIKYLKGETIQINKDEYKDGYVVVCVDEYPLGFGKVSKGVFKNKYPKSWLYH